MSDDASPGGWSAVSKPDGIGSAIRIAAPLGHAVCDSAQPAAECGILHAPIAPQSDMSDIAGLLKNEIIRLSKKVMKTHIAPIHSATSAHRRQLAALKRQVAALEREISRLRKGISAPKPEAAAEGRRHRFVAKGLKSLRSRLGLSAQQFALLIGVSEQTIYNWETKKAIPRAAQVERISSLRGIGKKEARARVESLSAETTAAAPKKTRQRRTTAAA